MFSRRDFLQATTIGAAAIGLPQLREATPPDYTLEIAPYSLELSHRRQIKTVAYNSQVPGPLLRFQEGKPVVIDIKNSSDVPEVVHWHGMFLPSNVDGAMEEGTPPIAPGRSRRITFTPEPSGFRWYHTHTFAGRDLKRGQFSGQHGCLWIEPRQNLGRYDAEFFLALHDWRGQLLGSGDGSMNPSYDVSTINGRVLGFGEPLRVKARQRLLLHILNSSATDCHWIALAGHQLTVVALDGNPVPKPCTVPMLSLAPAERISAIVELNNPGVWILGEVREHIKKSGMGIVIEYANHGGVPQWQQPETLIWDYLQFAAENANAPETAKATKIPLVFKSKFTGHGDMDHWTINGKSYPDTELIGLKRGERYRLQFRNQSADHHPLHLHRHTFELRQLANRSTRGIMKDVVLVKSNTPVDVEFTADNPGSTLFHCHQQDHMDMGFMMLFSYL